ncbi:TonB-dependent receptor plug domain-containing protein [Pleionea sediminis]|uniref:TonB-dependent receptor plug domain-containing protein n=1 Tax=Pleionea sediminis TaxID=2569479 RepID=UPI0011851782|nr:TonB-dependent receptor plug domain-containing protein [Pleionea sediminis]
MRYSWLMACVAFSLISTYTSAKPSEENEDEKKVIVTGSLIKKTDEKGPAPIFSLTSEDLAKLGHNNIFDALTALTAQTGSVLEGDQFPNGFTSAAQAINLRGFGPGRTLVLVNGQRFALNPTPYQSESNFFNLATIPTIAIERVDVLTDGASAIYGSDAVAGVINIILREEFDTNELTLTYGNTYEGGGESFKLAGGHSFRGEDKLFTLGYEWENREPIYGNQRESIGRYYRQREGLYDLTTPAISDSEYTFFPAPYDWFSQMSDPRDCDAHPELEYTREFFPDLPDGTPIQVYKEYCGRVSFGDESLRNERDRLSIYSRGVWYFDSGDLSFNILHWNSNNTSRNFRLGWSENYFLPVLLPNQQIGLELRNYRRIFSPLETGDQDQKFNEDSTSFMLAFDGFNTKFDYRFQLVTSEYQHKQTSKRLVAEAMMNFFIDPIAELIIEDSDGNEIAIVPVRGDPLGDIFNFYSPVELTSKVGVSWSEADSKSLTASYWMSGQGFKIGNRPIEYALVTEFNETSYSIEVDENSKSFNWYNYGGSSGRGDRERVAVGVEFLLPLFDDESFGKLDLTLAGRWDSYNDDSNVNSAETGKVALEWLVNEDLKIRGVKSSSFRAPDLHYLYANQTRYFTQVIDIYQCMSIEGNTYDDCKSNGVFQEGIQVDWEGSLDLEEETGTTQSIGFVYQPSQEFSLSLDFYDIELRNQVGLQPESQLMLLEAQCRLERNFTTGETEGWEVDSPQCSEILARFDRSDDDNPTQAGAFINGVVNTPVNRAFRRQKGVDLMIDGFYESSIGTLGASFQYSHIFETQIQEIESDPSSFDPDFRDSYLNGEIRTKSNLTLSWGASDWTSALSIFRKGTKPNVDGTSRLDSWKYVNFSLGRELEDDRFLIVIRNLFNEKPVFDNNQADWPYYDRSHYDAIGREIFLEYRLKY